MIKSIDDMLDTDTIYKNPEYIMPDYIPERFKHREDEYEYARSKVVSHIRHGGGESIVAVGPSGSGKSHLFKKLKKEVNQSEAEASMYYLSCKDRSPYYALVDFNRKFDSNFPAHGYSYEEVRDKLGENLKSKNESLIVILDEIENLNTNDKDFDTLAYTMSRWNELIDGGKIRLQTIVISNDESYIESISAKAYSTFQPRYLRFQPYTRGQYKDILQERVSNAFKKGIVENGVLDYLAARLCNEYDDMRVAFKLLKSAGDKVDMGDTDTLTVNVIKQREKELDTNELIVEVDDMSDQQLVVLMTMCATKLPASTNLVFENYLKLVSNLTIEKKSKRSLYRHILSKLESRGYVLKELKGRGRGKGVVNMYTLAPVEGLKDKIIDEFENRFDVDVEKSRGPIEV